jgi:hypothetical protein
MTDRKVLALASPALRRDVACPRLFRQAKRVNKQRVSQNTVERLISEGLLRWATPVEHSWSSPKGDEPERGLDLRAVAAFTRLNVESEEPEEMTRGQGAPTAIAAVDARVRRRLPRIPRALASRAPRGAAGR